MLLVVRFFPEITIKTRPVRRRFIRILRSNLLLLLRRVDPAVRLTGEWDNFEVETESTDPVVCQQIQDVLTATPGIDSVTVVTKCPLPDMAGILEKTRAYYGDQLAGKTFVVRCKRTGKHDFTSVDVERYVGTGLFQTTPNGGVDLENAEITVRIDIRRNELFVVEKKLSGLGGYPLGAQDAVLSMISGGFDSAVSSFQCIRRGLVTHYCFFNLGGQAHEVAVKELALYLWMKYGASHKVKFVTVPFEGVVADILEHVENSQMGVVLKRTMMRAADRIAQEMRIQALVTGESVAQVSSQTLANLALIDSVCETLVLRPLATADKQDIVDQARRIGTEGFSSAIPEYCGVISVKPTTRARRARVEAEESKLDASILEAALVQRTTERIDRVVERAGDLSLEPEVHQQLPEGAILVDIRHPEEQERQPLACALQWLTIPFYRLANEFPALDQSREYLLYCDRGLMSRLHASHLRDAGFSNVSVFRPG